MQSHLKIVPNVFNGEIATDSRVSLAWLERGESDAKRDLNPVIRDINALAKAKGLRVQWAPREQNLAGVYNDTRRATGNGL